MSEATALLFDHSLFNGHPRFFGYITSSPAPIGMLGDFLAAAVNPNVGGVAAVADRDRDRSADRALDRRARSGIPTSCGGLLVSGGNMANFVCFLAARAAKAAWDVRKEGLSRDGRRACWSTRRPRPTRGSRRPPTCSGSAPTRSAGLPTDDEQRMDPSALRRADRARTSRLGHQPFLVVGTAGSVSTGAVDPLPEIAAICREHEPVVPRGRRLRRARRRRCRGRRPSLRALSEADSVAVDPHKWLYAPLEAGCVLVRDAEKLRDAFSYHPAYYHFDDQVVNYFDYGPQNSRGFRALKVWLALRQVGRAGYLKMIGDDIAARAASPSSSWRAIREFEAMTQSLSITTFRYVPPDLRPRLGSEKVETLSRPAESGAADGAGEERRGVPVERGRRRPVRAARLHRELPHVARRRRGAAAAPVAAGKRERHGPQAGSGV